MSLPGKFVKICISNFSSRNSVTSPPSHTNPSKSKLSQFYTESQVRPKVTKWFFIQICSFSGYCTNKNQYCCRKKCILEFNIVFLILISTDPTEDQWLEIFTVLTTDNALCYVSFYVQMRTAAFGAKNNFAWF